MPALQALACRMARAARAAKTRAVFQTARQGRSGGQAPRPGTRGRSSQNSSAPSAVLGAAVSVICAQPDSSRPPQGASGSAFSELRIRVHSRFNGPLRRSPARVRAMRPIPGTSRSAAKALSLAKAQRAPRKKLGFSAPAAVLRAPCVSRAPGWRTRIRRSPAIRIPANRRGRARNQGAASKSRSCRIRVSSVTPIRCSRSPRKASNSRRAPASRPASASPARCRASGSTKDSL